MTEADTPDRDDSGRRGSDADRPDSADHPRPGDDHPGHGDRSRTGDLAGEEDDLMREEIDEVGRRASRTVELGGRAVVIAVAVFVLIVGLVLPWMNDSSGLEVLMGAEAGKASMVPRLFAATAVLFGVLTSALALTTHRWVFAWVGAAGGWFASVDGVLAIWSRQSSGTAPGIGMIIAVVAMVFIAIQWFRTAASRH